MPETNELELARTLASVLKPQKPEPYTGIVDAETCLNFVDSFEEYYTILSLNDKHWVSYVVLSLTQDARSWWRTSGLTLETTWTIFRETFIARFTPPDAANRARELLKALKQGRQSVAAYTNEFRRHLRLIPKMDKDDALFEYLRGLEKETSKQVRLRQPANLDAAITEATIIHTILFPDGIPQILASPKTTPEPMAMELDNLRLELNALRQQVRQSYSSIPKLSNQERDRLRLRGACFKCRKDGHMARECPAGPRSVHNITNVGAPSAQSGNAPSV